MLVMNTDDALIRHLLGEQDVALQQLPVELGNRRIPEVLLHLTYGMVFF